MSHNLLANLPCTSLIHRISSRRYKEKMRAISRVEGIEIIINNNSSFQNSPYNYTHGTTGYCTNREEKRKEDPRRRITRLLS